jgi:hypothetical protein
MIALVGTYWRSRYDDDEYGKVLRQSEFNVWIVYVFSNGIKQNARFRTWCLFKYWKHLSKLEGMVKLGE